MNGFSKDVHGTKVFFTVKSTKYDTSANDSTAIIKQDVTLTANTGVIDLNPDTVADTVEPGKYYFDMSVLDVAGEIYSIDSGVFTLTAGTTNREA